MATDQVRVRIVNTYSDGHTSTSIVDVDAPAPDVLEDDWWDDVIAPHTGDGHDVGGRLGYHYDAEIVDGPAGFLGWRCEWAGV